MDVDAVLSRPPIGCAIAELSGVGITDQLPLILSDQEWPARRENPPNLPAEVLSGRRLGVVGRSPVQHVMSVDCGD